MNKKKDKTSPDFSFELKFKEMNISTAGIDEAGRGAIAGPVVAAACALDNDELLNHGINDSKKLKAEQRENFYKEIIKSCIAYGVGIVDNNRIDKINILSSTMEAMKIAVEALDSDVDHLLIDGNYFSGVDIPFTTVIGGDTKCLSIAAASIIAKVTRDRWMVGVAHSEYPDYGFNIHKGYGTKKHYEAIEKFGICPYHRKTFLRKFYNRPPSLFD